MPDTHLPRPPAAAIEQFSIWWASIPLTRPYYTANNPKGRGALDVLLIRATDKNGRAGWGEACPALTGYSPETPQSGWAFLSEFLPKMLGQADAGKAELLASLFHQFPFVLSAYRECMDDLAGDPLLQPNRETVQIELAGTVNTLDAEEAARTRRIAASSSSSATESRATSAATARRCAMPKAISPPPVK